MKYSNLVVLLAIGLTLGALRTGATCTLNIHDNVPVMMKSDGHNRVVYAEEPGAIVLEEGDFVEAHCSSGIIFQRRLTNGIQTIDPESSKEVKCAQNSKIVYRDLNSSHYQDAHSQSVYITCQEPWKMTLYESAKKLPNCGGYMNYAMGVAVSNVREVVSAGMCYDLDKLSLKFVDYLAYRPKYDHKLEAVNTSALSHNILGVVLSTKLGNLNTFFTFMNQDAFNSALRLKKTEVPLLKPFDFDYVSLLQDSSLHVEFAAFTHIFNTMWWRSLRLGNWRFYLNALEERAKTFKYRVYMGTAGHVKIPSKPKSDNTATEIPESELSIEADSLTVDAPEYIWSYVKGLQDSDPEEFVVIAYNSPYYRVNSDSIFCPDLCDEIVWLKGSKFGKTRLMPTFGVTFCCKPQEVARTFKNFPLE